MPPRHRPDGHAARRPTGQDHLWHSSGTRGTTIVVSLPGVRLPGLAAGNEAGGKRHSPSPARMPLERPWRGYAVGWPTHPRSELGTTTNVVNPIGRTPLYLVIPNAAHSSASSTTPVETAEFNSTCAEPSRLAGSPAHRTCSSRREEVRPMGRKSRAKADHRAARVTTPGHEVGRTAHAGWLQPQTFGIDRPPDRQRSRAQASSPRVGAAAPSPLRAAPSTPATARQAAHEQLRCSWLVGPPSRRHSNTRSADCSVQGAAGPPSAGSSA